MASEESHSEDQRSKVSGLATLECLYFADDLLNATISYSTQCQVPVLRSRSSFSTRPMTATASATGGFPKRLRGRDPIFRRTVQMLKLFHLLSMQRVQMAALLQANVQLVTLILYSKLWMLRRSFA